jgi:hypothetical protein
MALASRPAAGTPRRPVRDLRREGGSQGLCRLGKTLFSSLFSGLAGDLLN